MKQHIAIEQLNELSDGGKEKLRDWWNPSVGDFLISKASGTYLTYGEERDFKENNLKDVELITNNETDSGYYGFCLGDTFPSKPLPEKYDYEFRPGKIERAKEILNSSLPLLSIGQMIEFLYENREDKRYKGIDIPCKLESARS